MKKGKNKELTSVSVRYFSYVDSIMAWGPFVKSIESAGYKALPRYASTMIDTNIREHRIDTDAPVEIVDRVIRLIMSQRIVFPWIIHIEITTDPDAKNTEPIMERR